MTDQPNISEPAPDDREAQLWESNARLMILQAQLTGWEAACTAQMIAARGYIDAMAHTAHTAAQRAARDQLELAIDSNAGETLLIELKIARERAERTERVVAAARVIFDPTGGSIVDLRPLRAALATYDAAKGGAR